MAMKSNFRLRGVVFFTMLGISINLMADEVAAPQAANGYWRTAENDGVVDFEPCKDVAGALCGTVVWDDDATLTGAQGSCGALIARLKNYSDGAWRDGWAIDPRNGQHYKAILRVKEGKLAMRSYIGTELLGETENFVQVDKIPAGCKSVSTAAAGVAK